MSKVLVIDDEAPLRENVAAFLEDDGFKVLTTGNAESALTKLPQFQPDVVVVDLRLEGASGEEFIKAAGKLYPRARYIIHTGCKDYRLPAELSKFGVVENHILFKPLQDLADLSALVSNLLPKSPTEEVSSNQLSPNQLSTNQ